MEKPQWSFINSPLHDPRQQNMECISNPAQKYTAGGFLREYFMCDGSLFTLWIYCFARLAFLRDAFTEWKRSVDVLDCY